MGTTSQAYMLGRVGQSLISGFLTFICVIAWRKGAPMEAAAAFTGMSATSILLTLTAPYENRK